jgi:hypothetical protein
MIGQSNFYRTNLDHGSAAEPLRLCKTQTQVAS